mgnify:FL=1|tara:strand:+ start:1294 stop:1554 length:261 start_codon:yes stop_codon:yes gene_type:complete
MFGQCLLLGTGIGGISTGIYTAFTDNKYDNRDRKNEYISIFCIILTVTTILLFIFHNSSQSLTVPEPLNLSGGGVSPLVGGGKPPF